MISKTLKKPQTSLQRQMTLTLSIIIVGLLVLIATPITLLSVEIQQQESNRERRELVIRLAQTIANLIENIQSSQAPFPLPSQNDPRSSLIATQITTALNLATSRVLIQLEEGVAQSQTLETILTANPQILGLARFDQTGQVEDVMLRFPDLALDVDSFGQTESFDLAQRGSNAQNVLFVPPYETPLLIVTSPLLTDNTVTGVMMAWVNIESIWQTLADLNVGETGYLYVVNASNQVVIGPTVLLQERLPPPIQSKLITHESYEGFLGGQVVGEMTPIENTPWQLVIEIPTSEANTKLRGLLIIVAAILMFGLSLALSVARLFSRWLLQPIQTLQQSALQISEGDLAHRITLERNDELGFLAQVFNHMVANLEDTINELRDVSLRLLSAEEAERQRIAYEIHDELGQTLTALRFSLTMIARHDPENPNLQTAQQLASDAQQKARGLSHELRPAMLDDLGLLPTLNWYIDRFEQGANLAISLETDVEEAMLPAHYKTVIYRLVAEALTNIHKHAQAEVVEISLKCIGQTLTLIIRDDGQGFDVDVLNQTQSLGIAGIQERVNLLRGNFSLQSGIGQGTTIHITLPLTQE